MKPETLRQMRKIMDAQPVPTKGRTVWPPGRLAKLAAELPLSVGMVWIPEPEQEYRFHTQRRWRFDYAWPAHRLALEVEGGIFTGGRHSRGAGMLADIEKYNAAVLAGWRLLRVTPKQVRNGQATGLVALAITGDRQ